MITSHAYISVEHLCLNNHDYTYSHGHLDINVPFNYTQFKTSNV